jgi:hypothetical protein
MNELFDEQLYQNELLCFTDSVSGCTVEIFTTDEDEFYVDFNKHLRPVLREVVRLLLPSNADQYIRVLLRQCVPNAGPYLYRRRGARYQGYFVNLNVADSCLWCQNVFQFAHEFCHVLCYAGNCDEIRYKHPNQWFEEALCHAAALDALLRFDRRLAQRLYSAEQRGVFVGYARAEANCRLARDDSLPTWYARNAARLRRGHAAHTLESRLLQSVVSLWLLDHFGSLDTIAPALRYLNQEGRAALLSDDAQQISLKRYLSRWLKACKLAKDTKATIVARKIYRAFSTTLKPIETKTIVED